MRPLDWIVLLGTMGFIVIYGIWKTRGSKDIEGYLKGDNSMKWWTIGLSIMATQASAITFLSTPGQAYEDGMRFVQFYFGLPIAMVIISITVIPIFYKLKVYTAYEFLENRFDLKTRSLAALLFLIQRGLAAGITIYAPAIILSTMLGWSLTITNLIIGVVVIIYTMSGGTKAVSVTQKQQMAVMMGGMIIAGIMVVRYLPDNVGFGDAVAVAGKLGKMNVVDFSWDWKTSWDDRYNFWSGMTGGLFLALSYFGTDQSQVARYLGGKSIAESRLGLLFNGLLKIPMQFLILFIGVMVFVFYQFNQPPVFFNEGTKTKVYATEHAEELRTLEANYSSIFEEKQQAMQGLVSALKTDDAAAIATAEAQVENLSAAGKEVREEVKTLIKTAVPDAETRDTDYVFISFVMKYLPAGLVGLLLAVIFSAAMSSVASELNALASTTVVDIYKRSVNPNGSDTHYLNASKLFTVAWGIIAILFATFASLLDNLIQAVNIIGSIFYGTILGIFLVAFYFKRIKGNAVFFAALLAEGVVLYCFYFTDIAFLWFNVIGCVAVILFGLILQRLIGKKQNELMKV
ncbi:sodium:solute symporter [Pontibacter sp. BT310]|uniref:Sodium:solute symporter n=1 Tax=Pontibacter populi TaxID=890055 RepID=A0ABS6X6K2_9BACT|nr:MULTISPECIES: sodium:solute symporter [Pontibacter]MBJ6116776.1 sodium:solute symporter [Pontibacter sp. BT310]MBR0569198.1 sodium:solute symporter [Microvirga sp. STS03]MBW3363629.1 sodium:solute symporter [Pontibacter populi]